MQRYSCQCIQKLQGLTTLNEVEKKALRPCRCFCLYIQQNEEGGVYKKTALTRAARLNHVKCMNILIKIGVDKIYSQKNNHIAVTVAVVKGYEEILEILTNSGIFLQSGLLRSAISHNRKTIAELLIKSGVDINDGSLGLAVQKGYKEIVDLLLQRRAKVNMTSTGIFGL